MECFRVLFLNTRFVRDSFIPIASGLKKKIETHLGILSLGRVHNEHFLSEP